MWRSGATAAVLLSGLWLAGCQTPAPTEQPPAPVEERGAPAGVETRGVEGAGAAAAATLPSEARAELLARRRVHFAFDSSAIDDESRAIIEAHAAHLAANPQVKLRLEGHCDERGTREYNLALGERRSQSVERLMKVLGVSGERITNGSFGEEKPLDPTHNESAWRLNRRVEIIY